MQAEGRFLKMCFMEGSFLKMCFMEGNFLKMRFMEGFYFKVVYYGGELKKKDVYYEWLWYKTKKLTLAQQSRVECSAAIDHAPQWGRAE